MLTAAVIILLLVGACWWTLSPFLRSRVASSAGAPLARRDLEARTEGRLLELKDLDFDREMGKIAGAEYEELRRDLVREAATLLRQLDQEAARSERSAARSSRAPHRRGGGGAAVVLAAALSAVPGGGAQAQADAPSTVTVRVINGTTETPGQAARLVLSRLDEGMEQLAALENVRGEAVFPPLPIAPDDLYLLQAHGAAPSSRMARGADLLAGGVEVTVYDTTADAAGLQAPALNLVIRRLGDALEVGWLLTLDNGGQPPRAIVPGERPALELRVPGGPAAVTRLRFNSGLMPLDFDPAPGSGPDRVGFDAPLPPGRGRLDLTARLPYSGLLTLPVEASMDIAAVTVFAFPTDMQIAGDSLSAHGVEPQTGFLVFRAPGLPRGETLQLAIAGGDPTAAMQSPHGGTGGGQNQMRVVEQRPASAGLAPWIVLVLLLALGLTAALRGERAAEAVRDDR